jgi:DNA modification methylase
MMQTNTVHHADFLTNTLPDKCAQLIIADPPYFEVKGDFDFIWSSFEEYLADVERWAVECKRLLADNGTLFWWGMDKKIAYSQVVLDRYFNLINTLVWERPGISSEWDTRRSFPERGMERILMYANELEDLGLLGKTGLEKIKDDPSLFAEIKSYLNSERKKSGKNMGWFISKSSTYCSHYFAKTSQWAFPTRKDYEAFQDCGFFKKPYEELRKEYEELRKEYEELRKEYEELRKEYEELRRPFNNYLNLTDVLKFSQDQKAVSVGHSTPKPIKLTAALLNTCSRPGDLVLVPFAGSGTECAVAVRYGRKFVAYEIDEKHVKTARRRVAAETIPIF